MQKFTRPLSPSARKFVPHSSPLPTRTMGAANDARLVPSIVANAGALAFRIGADGTFFVPFCEVKLARGLLKIDRESAVRLAQGNAVVESRGGMLAKLNAPVLRGHSDVPGRVDSDPSGEALGWVEDIAVEAAGMRLRIEWPSATDNPVAQRSYAYFEPLWLLAPVPGGFKPAKLVSIGLTNQPGTVAASAANDDSEGRRAQTLRGMDRADAIAGVRRQHPHLDYTSAFNLAARQNRELFAR